MRSVRLLAFALLGTIVACNAIVGIDEGIPNDGAGGATTSASVSVASASSSSASGGCDHGVCAPSVSGFSGPIVLLPEGSTCTQQAPLGEAVVEADIAMPSCACMCSLLPKNCDARVGFDSGPACSGNVINLGVPGSGSCRAIVQAPAAASVDVNVMIGSGCQSSQDTSVPPLAKRAACRANGPSCVGGATCVQKTPGALVCVAPSEPSSSCPHEYPRAVDVLDAATLSDTRACATGGACGCNVVAKPDCSGTLTLFHDSACTQETTKIPIQNGGPPQSCFGLQDGVIQGALYAPASLGTCTPTGSGAPMGGVMGTKTTLCCLP